MKHVIQQLEQVRALGRVLLVLQRLLQWVAFMLPLAVLLALVDWRLKLPAGMRVAIGLIVLVASVGWLVNRLWRVRRFWPELSTLALRAERMYPALAGSLASGVDFAIHAGLYASPSSTASFADTSIRKAQQRVEEVSLAKLLDPTRTLRLATVAALVSLLFAGVVIASPASASLAVKRWLMPLGDAQWPLRTHVQSLFNQAVWPIDTPLRLEAQVDRGYRAGMRTWAAYRLLTPGGVGPWKSVLMSEQAIAGGTAGARVGGFERLIDLAVEMPGELPTGAQAGVEFYFEAGDHRAEAQSVRLVRRPALRSLRATIEPPAYARGLVPVQEFSLDQQATQVAQAAALMGSTVRLTLTLSKTIPLENTDLAVLAPGLAPLGEAVNVAPAFETPNSAAPPTIVVTFPLTQTVQTPIVLVDEHGLSSQSERLYRIEATTDKPPGVTLVQPVTDESVLASAVVAVEGVAQDDVGLQSVALHAVAPGADRQPDKKRHMDLGAQTGSGRKIAAGATLELEPLALKPGDEVVLTAVAQDVYEIAGVRHEPVVSTPRRLRVIDAATLIGQLRGELAGLRQQAARLADAQRQASEQPAQSAQPAQQQLSRNLAAQEQLLDRLSNRMQRNQLEDPSLSDLLGRASGLVDEAQDASRTAEQKLGETQQHRDPQAQQDKRQEARAEQDKVSRALTELVTALDQGRDALALQLQLREMETEQSNALAQTRQMMPRTLGQKPEELSPQDRKALEELAERQKGMGQRMQDLAQQMQSTAQALSRQDPSPQNQAAASSLSEAASIAQRQGLAQQMQQAGQSAQNNQLSQAGQQQEQSLQTIRQMLKELQEQDRRRQEILRRQLAQLREAIEKLIENQKQQLARLANAAQLAPLEPGLATLRRNTLDVEQMARAGEESQVAADSLALAADNQGDAVLALRADQADAARTGQEQALKNLQDALRAIEEAQQRAAEEEAQQKREQLKQRYEALAKQQDELRAETAGLAGVKQPTRQQRAQIVALGHREADIRAEAQQIANEVENTLVFRHVHGQIDDTTQAATTRLRRAEVGDTVLEQQAFVSRALRMLADALEQERRRREFAGQQPAGGGGGGGGGQPPPLVPPIAELKLLRGVQQAIYDSTRTLEASADAGAERTNQLRVLSGSQRELAGVGKELIDQMQQQQQGPPGPGGAQ